jgi:hypothetical protein
MHTPKKWLKIPWINFNYHRVKIRKLPYRIKDYPLYFGKNNKFKDKTYDDNYDEIRSYCKDINFCFDELIDENDNLYDEFKFDDIYYFIDESDFITNGERNYFYFFINLFFSLLIDFFGLIYNEFFVLTFCGLSKDTHEGISLRAKKHEIELVPRQEIDEPEDNDYLENDD